MNPFEDSLHRVLARHQRRAIPVRMSREISSDPAVTFGVATIKIVTEEQIQAIAFGPLDAPPHVIVRFDPLGRDVADLIPFAEFLEQSIAQATATGSSIRVWIPHDVTLEALDVLGHRYWRNSTAPDEIVRMGSICRIIAHEAAIPGQQLIANAAKLLQSHVITGLSPIEEGHLGALLAWLDRTIADPLTESRDRVRIPASGVLPNTPDMPFDDQIDRLRKDAKSATGARQAHLHDEMDRILRAAVVREWQLMVEARAAFLRLALPETALDDLVADSGQRVAYKLANGFFPARAPDKLAAQLGEVEAGLEKVELAALEGDAIVREQAVRAGAVVRGTVSAVHQARAGFKPCDIEVESDQGVIRFRLDDKIRVLGTNVVGVVRELSATAGGGTRVFIEITTGFRTRGPLTRGAAVELIREPYAYINHRALGEVRAQQPWIFFGANPPVLPAGRSTGQSALAIAQAARRS
jgi:hypothetical protein